MVLDSRSDCYVASDRQIYWRMSGLLLMLANTTGVDVLRNRYKQRQLNDHNKVNAKAYFLIMVLTTTLKSMLQSQYVELPARMFSCKQTQSNRLRVCFCFCDIFEYGMK